MRAARATVAVLAAVAAGGGLALAQPEGADGRAKSADPARLRAEDLAESASQRFNEVMKAERVAQAQPAAPSSGQSTGDDPWTPAKRWLEHSNREFQSIMRRLAQSGGAASTPVPRPPRTAQTAVAGHGGGEAPARRAERGLADAIEPALSIDHAQARRRRRASAQERAGG